MTNNQIQYWKLQEERRHNEETEAQGRRGLGETERHNLANESVSWFSAKEQGRHNLATETETGRHNLADESTRWFTAQESQRHNVAEETISTNRLAEDKRHNVAEEGIATSRVAEDKRHNLVSESETMRHNKRSEELETDTAWIKSLGGSLSNLTSAVLGFLGLSALGKGAAAAAGAGAAAGTGAWLSSAAGSTLGSGILGAALGAGLAYGTLVVPTQAVFDTVDAYKPPQTRLKMGYIDQTTIPYKVQQSGGNINERHTGGGSKGTINTKVPK